MAEEIDLSPAEEAALERAWARVGPLLAPGRTAAPFAWRDQPRVPAGSAEGGEWGSGGTGGLAPVPAARLARYLRTALAYVAANGPAPASELAGHLTDAHRLGPAKARAVVDYLAADGSLARSADEYGRAVLGPPGAKAPGTAPAADPERYVLDFVARAGQYPGGLAPVWELRRQLGLPPDDFKALLFRLRREGKIRLVAVGDQSRLTHEQLRDSIQGENERFAYIEPGPDHPTAPFSADGPDLSGLGGLLNLSRQEVLDALFDAALDSFDLALPDAGFGTPDQPREPSGSPEGGRWASGGGGGDEEDEDPHAASPAEERAVDEWARSHGIDPALLREAANSWMAESGTMSILLDDIAAGRPGVGRPYLRAQALYRAVRAAPPNRRPLYRGSKQTPAGIESWTEDRATAGRWARLGGGSVHAIPAGAARALPLRGLIPRDVERQFLVDSSSPAGKPLTDVLFADTDAPFYSPDQPRDELGRWTSGGGVAGAGSAEDRAKAAAAMREQVAVYAELGISPVEANQGDCSTAAREAIKAIRAAGGEAAYGVPENNLAHVWVVAGGRHYDVQAPDGVDDPKDLPFFREEPDLIEGGWRSTADDRFGRVPALSATNRAGGVGRTPAEHAANRAAAADAVRAFARGQGPPTHAEAEALAGHLAKLTVSQIHALKAEHGLRGSAPNKAALVAKMAQRFAAWRAGRAPKEAVPGWPADYDVFGKRDVFADEPVDPGTLAPAGGGKGTTPAGFLGRAREVLGEEEVRRLVHLPLAETHREYGRKHQAFRNEEAKAVADIIAARTVPGFDYGSVPRPQTVEPGEVNRVEAGPFNFILQRDVHGKHEVLVSSGGRFMDPKDARDRGLLDEAKAALGLPEGWIQGDPVPPPAAPPPPAPPPAPAVSPIAVTPARYAKGQVAVRVTSSGEFKTRAHRLADAVGGRWSGREKAYIMSPTKAARLQALYAAGTDANPITGEFYQRKGPRP